MDSPSEFAATSLIDCHLHLWDPHPRELPGTNLSYGWMDGKGLPVVSRPTRTMARGAGAVVVEACADPGLGDAEAQWLGRLREENPWIRGIVRQIDLLDDAWQDTLETSATAPGVVGVRHNLEGLPAGAIGDSPLGERIADVGRAGLVFDICIRADQLGEVVRALAGEDCGSLVLDHLGKPRIADPSARPGGETFRTWARHLADFAGIPGTWCKVSGIWTQVLEAASVSGGEDSLHHVLDPAVPFLQEVLDRFGTDRVLWGSDHPVSTEAHGLSLEAATEAVFACLGSTWPEDPADVRDKLNRNAEQAYGLNRTSVERTDTP